MTSLEMYETYELTAGAQPLRAVAKEEAFAEPQEGARRALNVTVALLALILAAPLIIVIAILVKLTSPGPVLFCQARVGLNRRDRGNEGGNSRRRLDYGGKPFTIYKFRTMSAKKSSGDDQVWARPDDPRVTPVGRILRKYRLDELPQLFNVLRGDMNIVGPRPEQLRIFANLREKVDGYAERQRVRPGITGWAQVNSGYDANLDDVRRKVAYDLEFIARRSVMEDLKIMLMTAPVVVFRRGAW
ncbi:MAG: sugar transferase [Gemmatimonadetes bacterium]|nr:sugar transferase [Gemmatimonadota bacterium]